MSLAPLTSPAASPHFPGREWAVSCFLYLLFTLGVFLAMGPRPLLGPDHLSYMRLADDIASQRPTGDYWRSINSVQSFSVLLAGMHHLTGSHVLSMRLILAGVSVPYLLSADLLFGLFTTKRWERRLFALMSAFSVSFGVASWGITDYTALLPRTLVMPVILTCIWFYLRFFSSIWRYAVFVVLVLFSVLHLSTFYALGIFIVFEFFDFFLIRHRKVDRRLLAFPLWLLAALTLLLGMQGIGISTNNTGFLASMFPKFQRRQEAMTVSTSRSTPRLVQINRQIDRAAAALGGAATKTSTPITMSRSQINREIARATPSSDSESSMAEFMKGDPSPSQVAWYYELTARPWRNMPLPWINVANILSSSAVILILALLGAGVAWRESPTRGDLIMAWWVPANLIFALAPQTGLWILRQFTAVFPINIEEIRSLSFLMVPMLYFCLRLFGWLGARHGLGAVWGRPLLVALFLMLPLTMKSLTPRTREELLSVMTRVGLTRSNLTALSNARSALGLSNTVPLFYSVQGASRWLETNARRGSLVLTDRDDILARDFYFVGSHQEVALADFGSKHSLVVLEIHQQFEQALADHDLSAAVRLAATIKADYVIVPWPAQRAAYRDTYFSVIDLH